MENTSLFENTYFDENTNRWIVTNNDSGLAAQLKQLYPYVPVYLYDQKTKKYTQYTIEHVSRTPHMANGRLLYSEETIKI